MHDRVADLRQEVFRVTSAIHGPSATHALRLHDGVVIGLEILVAADQAHVEHVLSRVAGLVAERADDAAHVHVLLVGALAGQRMQSLLSGREHQEQDRVLRRVDQARSASMSRPSDVRVNQTVTFAPPTVKSSDVSLAIDQRRRKVGRIEVGGDACFKPVPLLAIERGNVCILDQQPVVDLRAEAGRAPVGAAGPDGLRLARFDRTTNLLCPSPST